MDFDGLSMKQVMGITPSFCMKLLNFIQDAMPLRLKEVRLFAISEYFIPFPGSSYHRMNENKLRSKAEQTIVQIMHNDDGFSATCVYPCFFIVRRSRDFIPRGKVDEWIDSQVHVVKQPFLFNMVWQMIKPLVKEKLKNRIHIHGSKMSSFHNYIPATYLPENYGGELPKINYTSADWYPVLLKHEDKIKRAFYS